MTVSSIREHIEIVEGAGGPKARIVGSRIRVIDIVILHERMRMSVGEIAREYPTITTADIYAALTWYWDHKQEINQQIRENDEFARAMRRQHGDWLIEKLKRMRAEALEPPAEP